MAAALWLAASAAPVAAETIRVRLEDLAFIPRHVSVRVGDTVEWVNADFVAHTATARDGEWDVEIPAEGTGRIMLTQTGTVAYYCQYHPGMTGSIAVEKPP
ncbi:cupredoxin domain-containing protein [Methylobacterium nigriterrae]|uniref:cupredoxin domain-containing protein n=1 Tax=Methylobacterium nigriterrae TaxID=3127512 RepID=UPI0030135830